MGWWSADILGGDTPWDEIGELERVVGWESDSGERGFLSVIDRNEDLEPADLREELDKLRKEVITFIHAGKNSGKINEYVLSLNPEKQFVEILADVYTLIALEFKLSTKIEKLVRAAIPHDYKDWEEREDRKIAVNDLLRRMDIAAGRAPSNTQYKVTVRKEVEGILNIEVTAPTEKLAGAAAEKLAKHMKPDNPIVRISVRQVTEVK